MKEKVQSYTFALLRIALGWIFLWAFADKLWGLGFTTKPEQAWLNGGSPTTGFLKFGTRGPLAENFQSLAGSTSADWLFMGGLLLIGTALILGIGMRLAVAGGITLLLLMWLATLPPVHNPFLDEHIVYSLALLATGLASGRQRLGLGDWWQSLSIVRRYPVLR